MRPFCRRLVSLGVYLLASGPVSAQLSVTPDGGLEPNRAIHTSGWTTIFTVQNNSPNPTPVLIGFTCSVASSVTSCTPPGGILLGGNGSSTNVTVTYSVGNVGSGGLTLRASSTAGADDGYKTVPVVLPGGAPRLNVLPYLEAKQDLGRCAASCFAATYAQSTVPYFSLDAPRNVTVAYHGDRVAPKPIVLIDVAPDSGFGSWPSEFQLQVKVNSVLVTFVNGEQTLRFSVGATNDKTYRIGGQFTPSSLTHGTVYPIELLVSAKIGSTLYTNRWITQYLHVDEAGSAVARGWTVGGVQRAFVQGDGSVLITEGDGSAVYFKKVTTFGVATYEVPPGEFSKLTLSGAVYTRAYPDSTKVAFGSTGYMTSITDRWGSATTVTYDGSNRVSQIKDPLLNAITLAYGANGLTTITDPMSRATTVTVDASKRLTAMQDPDGVSTTFGYDGSLRLSTVTNRRGKTTTIGYLQKSGIETNKLATITAPTIPVFGGSSSAPATTFAPWQVVGVPYAATATTAFVQPRADTIYARITEPQGASYVTRFTVNRWGSPMATTNPLNETTTIAYTTNGQPTTILKPGFGTKVDTLIYDGSGLVVRSRPAGDSATTIGYGGWAQPTSVATTGRPTVTYSLGAAGRVNSVSWGGATRESYTYDTYGRLLRLTNGVNTVVRRLGYPTTGTTRNVSVDTLPGNRITAYVYDTYGRRTTVTPPFSVAEVTHYSVINRVDSVRVLTSPVTRTKFTYDNLYLTGVTDPKNQVYSYVYNDLGWLIKQVDPAAAPDTFQYNVGGELKRKTTRRALDIDFSYDVLHRLTSRAGSATATWTYTANSLVATAAVTGVATVTTYPSLLGPPDSVITVLNGKTYRQQFRYRSAGLDTVRFTGSQDATHFSTRNYLYDANSGALTTIKLASNSSVIGYDQALDPTSYSFPGGGSRTVTLGSMQWPVKNLTETANNSLLERWIGINYQGQIDRHQRNTSKTGRWFDYDSLGQLRKGRTRNRTPEGIPGGCPTADFGMSQSCSPDADYNTIDSLLYVYDAVGNRTDKGGTYGTGNRITNFDNCTYKTDAEGNVVQRAGVSCAAKIDTLLWTREGQLDSMKLGSTGVKFLYDADGRLTVKRVNGAVVAYLLWDGANLLAELDNTASAVVVEYSYYPGLDNPHAVIRQPSGQRFYARMDGLGSVIALTNESNAIRRDYVYDDWGKLTGGTDSESFNGTDRARWKGALHLGPEAELYYMRNRWYEPHSGRFLSEDPVGIVGGLNNLSFAGSDPINRRDPAGLVCEWVSTGSRMRSYKEGGIHVIQVISLGFWLCSDVDFGGELLRWSWQTGGRGAKASSPGSIRPLTLAEQFRYGDLCSTMDCSKVLIHENTSNLIDNRAFARCNDLLLPAGAELAEATVVHELAHAGQCQSMGLFLYYAVLGAEQVLAKLGVDVYDYRRYGTRYREGRAQAAADCMVGWVAAACGIIPSFPRP